MLETFPYLETGLYTIRRTPLLSFVLPFLFPFFSFFSLSLRFFRASYLRSPFFFFFFFFLDLRLLVSLSLFSLNSYIYYGCRLRVKEST